MRTPDCLDVAMLASTNEPLSYLGCTGTPAVVVVPLSPNGRGKGRVGWQRQAASRAHYIMSSQRTFEPE